MIALKRRMKKGLRVGRFRIDDISDYETKNMVKLSQTDGTSIRPIVIAASWRSDVSSKKRCED